MRHLAIAIGVVTLVHVSDVLSKWLGIPNQPRDLLLVFFTSLMTLALASIFLGKARKE